MYAVVAYPNSSNKLTEAGGGLLEKLMDAQLTKKFPSFMVPEIFLLCSEDPVYAPSPDSSPHPHTLITISFNNIVPSMPLSSSWFLPVSFSR
jgi:hypothetical protein